MNAEQIDEAFQKLIFQRAIHERLGVTSGAVRNMRYNLKNGIAISTDKKLELLKKSGWQEEEAKYTRADLVSLARFCLRQSSAAKEQGAEYIVEKWEVNNGL